MPQPDPKRPRRSSAVLRVGLSGLVLLLGCVALEVGYRGYLDYHQHAYDREQVLGDMRRLAGQMVTRELRPEARQRRAEAPEDGDEEAHQPDPGRHLLHPYLAFEAAYAFRNLERDTKYFTGSGPDANFDVLVLGGSVAAGFGNTMEPVLAALLEESPLLAGRRLRVHSYGRGSYKQPQQVLMLSWLLTLGFKPDLVLNLDGFNEVAVANANVSGRQTQKSHPFYPAVGMWTPLARGGFTDRRVLDLALPVRAAQVEAGRLAREAEDSLSMRSAILGNLRRSRLRKLYARYLAAQEVYLDYLVNSSGEELLFGPSFELEGERAVALFVQAWRDGSRMLAGICASLGIAYVHCLQPTLHDAGSKPLTPQEIASGSTGPAWREGVRVGYPLMRAAGVTLGESGILFVDGSLAFQGVEETLYYDACHFHRPGHEILARRIAQALLQAPAGALPARGPGGAR